VPVPPATRISSRHHAVVQRCRRLARRAEPGVVLLDGAHVIDEALNAGVAIECLITDERDPAIAAAAERAGVPIHVATAAVMEAISPVRTPSGVVAIAHWQPASLASALERAPALVVGLRGVQDPGNFGSAIRAADALGASAVLALEDSADPGGWKALRGAMGSTFHLPVATAGTADAIAHCRAHGLQVAATVAAAGRDAAATDLRAPTLVLLGSEGRGLPDDLVAEADVRVTIPMSPRVNSLNVAVTAALILYEARRQRAGAG
jgi:TrmH family RNA methyltransferase